MNYQCREPREYLVLPNVIDNSDHMIAYWMNRWDVNHVSAMELELESSYVSDFMKDFGIKQNIISETLEILRCQLINLCTGRTSQIIQIYDGI